MRRPKQFTDDDGNELNGQDEIERYEREMEFRADEDRELKHEHDNETNFVDAK